MAAFWLSQFKIFLGQMDGPNVGGLAIWIIIHSSNRDDSIGNSRKKSTENR